MNDSSRRCADVILVCPQWMTAIMLEEWRVGVEGVEVVELVGVEEVVGVEVSVARQVMLPGGR